MFPPIGERCLLASTKAKRALSSPGVYRFRVDDISKEKAISPSVMNKTKRTYRHYSKGPSPACPMPTSLNPIHNLCPQLLTLLSPLFQHTVLTGIQVRSERNTMSRKPLDHSIMRTSFNPINNLCPQLLTFLPPLFQHAVLTGIQVQSETNTMSRKPLVHTILPVNFKHWHNNLEKL